MDYSLLLGIETTNVKILPTSLSEPPFSFADYARTVKTSILLKQSLVVANSASIGRKNPFEEIDIAELFAESHRFKKGRKIFHISIIDYLQEWNLSKKSERLAKTLLMNKDGDKLSAIEPNAYADRFRNFMNSYVFY